MRSRGAGLGLLLALLPAGAATAETTVRYVAPERFTDAENRWGSGPSLRATLAETTRLLEDLGRRYLPPGESLDVTVLDIDLAGFERPALGMAQSLRVVTDATPPRIRFSYVLRRGGRRIAAGEETLSDIDFMRDANPRFSSGGLYYERALLRRWFQTRFPARAGG